MTEQIRKMRFVWGDKAERGMAMVVAIFVIIITTLVAGSFSLIVRNEIVQSGASDDTERALYAAEAGIWDTLYQKSKLPITPCFPFDNNVNLPAHEAVGKPAAGMWTSGDLPARQGSLPMCSDLHPRYQETPVHLPRCWAFDERLLPDHIAPFAPPRSNPYRPLAVYPSSEVHLGDSGWTIDGTSSPGSDLPTPTDWIGVPSNTHYTSVDVDAWTYGGGTTIPDNGIWQIGFFTNCNDLDVCGNPPCTERIITSYSLVSIGAAKSAQGAPVRRAIKVDLTATPMAVIDEYVDLTGLATHRVGGPIHINGLCGDEDLRLDCHALHYTDIGFNLVNALTGSYDSYISVSYPEDPSNPNFPDNLDPLTRTIMCAILPSACDIVWVHLPVTMDIPAVKWDTMEDRMEAIRAQVLNVSGRSHPLVCNEKTAGAALWSGAGTGAYSGTPRYCNLAHRAHDDDDGGLLGPMYAGNDEDVKLSHMWRCQPPSGWDGSHGYYDDGNITTGVNSRIHNCRSARGKYSWIQDTFFELCNYNDGSKMCTNPATPTFVETGGLGSVNDYYVVFDVLNMVLSGCLWSGDLLSCFTEFYERPVFTFVGAHRLGEKACNLGIKDADCPGHPPGFNPHASYVRDIAQPKFVFDGDIAWGRATPVHSCGPRAPLSFSWSATVDFLEDLLDYACLNYAGWWIIPPILAGIPHYHVGSMEITGEVVVGGSVFMQNQTRIAGGALYAVDDILKKGSSGLSITFNAINFITFILSCIFSPGCSDYCLPIVDICVFRDIIGGLLAVLFPGLVGDQRLLHNDVGLYVDGGNAVLPNSGLIYTRGSFKYESSEGLGVLDGLQMIFSLLSMFELFGGLTGTADILGRMGFGLGIAEDPARLTRGGAIIARRDVFIGGDDAIDLHIPQNEVGFVFAGVNLQVREIGSRCSPGPLFGACTQNTWGHRAFGIGESTEYARGVIYGKHLVASRDLECILNPDDQIHDIKDRDPDTAELYDGSEYADLVKRTGCYWNALWDIWDGLFDPSVKFAQWNIQGNVFAGKVVSMSGVQFRTKVDWTVYSELMTRAFMHDYGGTPMNWMEIPAPVMP